MENVAVVLSGVRNPLNIGAAARAMANFGFTDLRLVNAYRVAAEEARAGPNADAVLQNSRDFADLAEATAGATLIVGTTSATKRDVRLEVKSLAGAAPLLAQNEKIAILFGSEKFGLSNEEMTHCHWLLRIPTLPEVPSMNLGQAVAVTLYELIRQPLPAQEPSATKSAPAGLLNELTARVHESLQIAGYVHTESVEDKLRLLLRRMRMRESDAVTWLGIFRQLLWKLKLKQNPDSPPPVDSNDQSANSA
jgi:tRNA/rRNA methyltransferase